MKIFYCAVFGLAFALMSSMAAASGCVSEVFAIGSKRPGGMAAADIISVTTFETVKDCNSALDFDVRNMRYGMMAKLAESATYTCKVPSDCSPSDEYDVRPESRVVPMRRG